MARTLVGSAIGLPGQQFELNNLGLSVSVGGNAMTVAAKIADGVTDPSSASPIRIGFRSSSAIIGGYNARKISAPLSLTISSGSTLGMASGWDANLWVYAIDSDGAGTVKLGVSQTKFDDSSLKTTVAEGGAGGADLNSALYSDGAYTSKPIRLIGRITIGQSTAGAWVSAPTEVSVISSQLDSAYQVMARFSTAAGQSIASGGTPIVDFGSKEKDLLNNITTGGSWKFIANEKCTLKVRARITYASAAFTANNVCSMSLYKGGALQKEIGSTWIFSNTTAYIRVDGLGNIDVNAGDYVDVRIAHGEGTARSLYANAGFNFIEIEKV